VLAFWAFYGEILADHLNGAANPNRVRFYVLTLFFEWLLFVLVVAGVRPNGAPVLLVLGDRWHSVREVLRDVGIAAAFWIVSAGMLLCWPGSCASPPSVVRWISYFHMGVQK
jgi:hypothetical protein